MSIGFNGKRATFNGRSPDKPAVEVKNSLTRVGKEFQVTARELQKAIERNPALKMALLMALGIVEKTGKGDAKGVIIEILMALPPAELAKLAKVAELAQMEKSAEAVKEEESVAKDIEWTLGVFKSETKWANQLEKRSWTKDQSMEALTKGESFPADNLVNKDNPATRYIHPETGQSVVIDEVTKEVIHVGGPGFKY